MNELNTTFGRGFLDAFIAQPTIGKVTEIMLDLLLGNALRRYRRNRTVNPTLSTEVDADIEA